MSAQGSQLSNIKYKKKRQMMFRIIRTKKTWGSYTVLPQGLCSRHSVDGTCLFMDFSNTGTRSS